MNAAVTFNAALIQVFLCAIWALGQVGIKAVGTDISPLFHAGVRSAGASLVLLAWILYKRPQVFKADGSLGLGLIIGILFGLEFVFLFKGLTLTSASRGTLLLYTSTFFVAIGAHFFVPSDKLTKQKIAGLSLAFIGVVIAIGPQALAGVGGVAGTSNDANSALVGDIMCLIAAFFWGATTVVVKATRLRSALPEKNLIYQIGVSSVVLLIAAMLFGEKGITTYTPLLLGVLGYGVFVVASASYLAWFWLVSKYKASTLHTFTFLTPLFAILLGALLIGEPVNVSLLASAALIAAGIVLVNLSK
jgi:drug/metabolite transporter (DMT)-like permease